MPDVVGLYGRFGVRLPASPFENAWVSVRCFTGTHPDRHPSARVHLRSGGFKCFTCGAKGGVLDALAYLGVWDRDEARRLAVDHLILDPPQARKRSRPAPFGVRPLPAPPDPAAAGRVDYDHLDRSIVRDRAWTYLDAAGEPVGRVHRLDHADGSKKIWQERWTGSDWQAGMAGQHLPLYRLPDVLSRASRGHRILVVEGEKVVDALDRIGIFATTNPGGAGKWRDEHTLALEGAQVLVIADCDLVGRLHAIKVTQDLYLHQIRVLVPFDPDPGRDDGYDIVDDLAAVANTIRAVTPELTPEQVRARLHDHVHGLLNGQLPVDAPSLQRRYEYAIYTANPAGHAYLHCDRCDSRRVHTVKAGIAYCPCGHHQPAPSHG